MHPTPKNSSPKSIEWANRLARFEASGRFVNEFCRAEGVSVPNFYRWRKILSDAIVAPTQSSEFIEVGPLVLSPEAGGPPPEVPDSSADSKAGALSIRLELGHGLVLHIERH